MSDTKQCPYCGKLIMAEARKCRYCKNWIEMGDPNNIDTQIGVSIDTTKTTSLTISINNRNRLFKKLHEQEERLRVVSDSLSAKRITLKNDFNNCQPIFYMKWGLTKVLGILSLIALGALLLLHCIVWLFGGSFWSAITTVFFWGISATGGAALINGIWNGICKSIYKQDLEKYNSLITSIEKLEKEKNSLADEIPNLQNEIKESFKKDFNEIVGIPISTDIISLLQSYEINKVLIDFNNVKNNILCPEQLQSKEKLANERLKLFYNWAVRGEAPNTFPAFYKLYSKAEYHNDWNMMRREPQDEKAFSYLSELNNYETLLNDNRMEGILSRFDKATNRDVTGVLGFCNVEKMSQQTQDMYELYNAAKDEYEELDQISSKINYLLEFVRVCAFRNIFLGIELLGIVREIQGGKSLTTQKDSVGLNSSFGCVQVNTRELNTNITSDFINSIVGTADVALGLMENKQFRKQLQDDPKKAKAYIAGAAAVAIIGGAFNYVEERNKKIEQNTKKQKELVKNFQIVFEGYRVGQEGLFREMEIIRSIKEANKGFMAIYEPMRRRVFDEQNVDSITPKDIATLSQALKSYNNISKSKL